MNCFSKKFQFSKYQYIVKLKFVYYTIQTPVFFVLCQPGGSPMDSGSVSHALTTELNLVGVQKR